MTRRILVPHGVPCTLTSVGRVTNSWTPGPANRLVGVDRYREAYARLNSRWRLPVTLRLMVSLWRHGFVLSGGPVVPSLHQKVKRQMEWESKGMG